MLLKSLGQLILMNFRYQIFMTNAIATATDVNQDDYLVIGLATCFVKDEGEVHEIQILEPIPSAALEAIVKGIPTSYQMALGTTLGAVWNGESLQKPDIFPAQAEFCKDFDFRATSAARTYKARPTAQTLIPLGTVRNDFQYSLERKRVLNQAHVVKTEDNVKQHEYTHKVL